MNFYLVYLEFCICGLNANEWLIKRNIMHQGDVSFASMGSNTGVIMGNMNSSGDGVSIVGSSMVVFAIPLCATRD